MNKNRKGNYVVIFTSQLNEDVAGYDQMARKMENLVNQQPGFLGMTSLRGDRAGITLSYWESLEAINNWKNNAQHQSAKLKGVKKWYADFETTICVII